MSSEEELKKAQFFYDFVSKIDPYVQQTSERLYKKVHESVAIASTLIPITFGLGYFISERNQYSIVFLPIAVSIISFFFATIQGVNLLKSKWLVYVDPLILITDHQKKSLSFIINKSASSWADTINRNIETINSKEKGFKWMLRFVIAGLSFLVIAFVVFVSNTLGLI